MDHFKLMNLGPYTYVAKIYTLKVDESRTETI